MSLSLAHVSVRGAVRGLGALAHRLAVACAVGLVGCARTPAPQPPIGESRPIVPLDAPQREVEWPEFGPRADGEPAGDADIVAALAGPSPDGRLRAAHALKTNGAGLRRVLPAIESLLAGRPVRPESVILASDAIACLGPDGARTVPAFISIVEEIDAPEFGVNALFPSRLASAVGPDGLVPHLARLRQLLRTGSSSQRVWSARMVAAMGSAGTQAAPELIENLRSESSAHVGAAAGEAIGLIGEATPEFVDALVDAVDAGRVGTAWRAAEALGRLRCQDSRVRAALERAATTGPSREVRIAAETAWEAIWGRPGERR